MITHVYAPFFYFLFACFFYWLLLVFSLFLLLERVNVVKTPVKKPFKICLLLLSNHTEKQPEVNAQQKKQRKNSFLLFLQRKSCLFSKFCGFLW